ncbi:uncharacterized protein STEHIDRAFT_50368 [Stereum hirsutum FP-91666 SS1]|uniref:uncharacterized protein n=1 Tax=Stereum hirsutum (strain FP-91666) TaxID=721885 RepID=UPI000440CBCD|nr:uncharacterized protein STEHIDRAFT_50368 [Stereum hirsutum FP-91666 SS1]EIM89942.1 hypothetical protein STEHIDRAFT_50368 [Stereum hirsutum FP-91666 SS1]
MGRSQGLSRPLPDTHPELLVFDIPGLCKEFRVENWHLARDGSRRPIRGAHALTWFDALLVLLGSALWPTIGRRTYAWLGIAAIALLYLYIKCTQVLWESVLVIPPHGIQFETHRGFPGYPLFASRNFIPLTALQNFVINEGLYGWNVRFYLAALQQLSDGSAKMDVAYENIKPHFPVLIEIYHSVHEYLHILKE